MSWYFWLGAEAEEIERQRFMVHMGLMRREDYLSDRYGHDD